MSYVLLVEGRDDAFVVKNLCDHYAVQSEILSQDRNRLPKVPLISIKDEKGVDRILDNITIPNWLRGSEITRLGIIVDADMDLGKR